MDMRSNAANANYGNDAAMDAQTALLNQQAQQEQAKAHLAASANGPDEQFVGTCVCVCVCVCVCM
jgi:hypothetical protein